MRGGARGPRALWSPLRMARAGGAVKSVQAFGGAACGARTMWISYKAERIPGVVGAAQQRREPGLPGEGRAGRLARQAALWAPLVKRVTSFQKNYP